MRAERSVGNENSECDELLPVLARPASQCRAYCLAASLNKVCSFLQYGNIQVDGPVPIESHRFNIDHSRCGQRIEAGEPALLVVFAKTPGSKTVVGADVCQNFVLHT
jgi:hypothetical protein